MNIFIVFFLFTCLYHFALSLSLSQSAIFNILCHLNFPIHSFPVVKKKMVFFRAFFSSLCLSSQHIQLRIYRCMMFAMHRNDTIIQVCSGSWSATFKELYSLSHIPIAMGAFRHSVYNRMHVNVYMFVWVSEWMSVTFNLVAIIINFFYLKSIQQSIILMWIKQQISWNSLEKRIKLIHNRWMGKLVNACECSFEKCVQ